MAAKIKKGDKVYVIAGDHKGTSGVILNVYPKISKVLIEGVNVKTKHVRPSMKNPEGGVVKKEYPVHISNVALANPGVKESLDWSNELVTRVGFKWDEDGKKIRYAKRSGKDIL
jgi:large subunit ribosomal protein L24